jgi:hypothetical protein
MGKSSIHVRSVRAGSEQHNEREKKLGYVREDLSPLNSSFKLASIAQARADVMARYQASTGQRMQAKAAPIREGVLLIEERHTAEDLRKVGQAIEARFGIRTIQGYAHKDEGHYDQATGQWKPNYHGHLVFDWTDQATGKSIRMKRDDMAELQTIVAKELGLERGQSSSIRHLNSIQFKRQQEEQSLKTVYKLAKGLPDAFKAIREGEEAKKELEPLREQKKGLELENALLRENRKYLENLNEEQRQELKKTEEQKQSRGLKR